ncbi:hypothetical protein [Paracoccus sp. (in: a-proteobacteria)]|uniref:hypothetical protein n=1 Tax=Paracoccus sp. TaxID=267 RepID=UPI0026DF2A6A|nr:hypothetical protein [Paracoccus sp. (in: a-proteobacteria)]MDO5370586.1 hypothetical protein [Paracoccus sp. (in: a-proteobacteria)]
MPAVDGSLNEWSRAFRLDGPATGTAGFGLWGFADPAFLYFAIGADSVPIGESTTLWLDTDLDRATGHQIWGWAGGAEYHVEVAADGRAGLYTGGPRQTLVGVVEAARSSDGRTLEMRIDRSLLGGSSERVRVFADVNDTAFLPNSYADVDLVVGGPMLDMGAGTRLDAPGQGAAGHAFYGDLVAGTYVFAITSDSTAIGAGTTIWIDADLDRTTGHQIWGWAGGAEYNINIGADGVARLYTGGAGETHVADLIHRLSSDRRVLELAAPRDLLAGDPARIRVFADVNDAVFLPNDYANADLVVGEPVPVSAGGKILDGLLVDWLAGTRLDSPATGAPGHAFYGDLQQGAYTFAIATGGTAIGANTTIWLDTDLSGSTGYQVWGWAVGAEYNVNIGADGVARLYSGGAGQTLVAEIDHVMSGNGTVLEIAIDQALLGNTPSLRAFADVNDSVFIPNAYATANFIVGTPPVRVGPITLDGNLSDWAPGSLLHEGAGHQLRGDVLRDGQGAGHFVLAIASNGMAIGQNTTIWIDSDRDSSTGHQIWGWAGGAEYNINITADGKARLYSGAAGGTFVAELEYAFNADRSGFEVALPQSILAGVPSSIRVLADVNDSVFLPGDYTGANLVVGTPPPPPDPVNAPGARVAIVYSATTAANFYDVTAYGQLFMAAQNQAMQAGIPFDLLNEGDLLDPANLAGYDAIIFPGFSHAQSGQVAAIAASLTTAVQQYGVGLIAAGNFLTNDQTGAAIAGNAYSRMSALLGVTLEGYGQTNGIRLQATDAGNPILDGYGNGEVVGTYGNVSYLYFKDTTGTGQVLFDQVVGTGGSTVARDAVIATQTGGRNVHFATDAILGNNNILGEAIDWIVQENAPDVSLLMTRGSSLFYSRNDMDQSQEVWDVSAQDPGIYDAMLPIIRDWYDRYGFVGSYYINVGANPPDQTTDWAVSKPYYEAILGLESAIGTHSYTHPHDTNVLLADTPQILALVNRVDPRNPNAVDPWTLTQAEQDLLFSSYRFQFETSKLIIEQKLGIEITGAAVPGAPERVGATREMIKFFDYLSGGYSGVGAGYPGAFGYLTPGETGHVYIAPNMSFDFSLVGWYGMTPQQAEAAWLAEYDRLIGGGTTPILAFPWHDYGPTNWNLGDPAQVYSLQMFESLIARAAADGAEFVTGQDLAGRIESFSRSSLTAARAGDVLTVTVQSSDAGNFALDVGKEGKIASVANWYAWDQDSVFLPKQGGTFQITLGPQAADVTHVAGLPMRGELISVSGNGTDLDFSFFGRGSVLVELASQGARPIHVTGADGASLPSAGTVSLVFDAVGQHAATIDFLAPGSRLIGSAAKDILLGGSADDILNGGAGNDVLHGGAGADRFVFTAGFASDVILDFQGGSDRLDLQGLGFATASAAHAAFQAVAGGLALAVGGSDRLLLAGLDFNDFSVSDILVDSFALA